MAGRRAAVVIVPVKTSGDRIQDRPLAEIGGKALWTKELDLALLAGETDCSVHSMKDVESERPDDAAHRRDAGARRRPRPADRRAVRSRRCRKARCVGTSSPRRAAQLKRLRPDLRIVPIRGNVETRLAKVEAGEVDATLLAAAGLDRLGRDEVGRRTRQFDEMLPAPAQGAIGIECRADDAMTSALLSAIDHRRYPPGGARRARLFPRAGRNLPFAGRRACARVEGGEISFALRDLERGWRRAGRRDARFAVGDLETPAALARAMLARAPRSIRAPVRRRMRKLLLLRPEPGAVDQRRAGAGDGTGGHHLPLVPRRAGRMDRARPGRL